MPPPDLSRVARATSFHRCIWPAGHVLHKLTLRIGRWVALEIGTELRAGELIF